MVGYDILIWWAAMWLFASIPASILMGGVIGFGAGPQGVPVRCAPAARSSVRMVDIGARTGWGAE